MADRAYRMRGTQVTFNIPSVQICNMTIQTNPLDALVAFIFFVLLGFLQVRYPENPTPFHLHPKTIWVAVATFLAYCLGSLGRFMYAIRDHRFDTLINLFGSLSLLCLVVLMLPESWESFHFVIYTLCFIIYVLFAFITTRFREIWVQPRSMRRVMRPVLPITSGDASSLITFVIGVEVTNNS
ncbi:unnamed protein product [Sphenostylis stenocarpa]|uniref:Uncharacterized protein n=1 Tax=Sphenostylis stenocarpa TaxID=92480 RepID=A0AA86VG68_9FABA|nr:unnamed protein product [Sphenostylis stenocarpa]